MSIQTRSRKIVVAILSTQYHNNNKFVIINSLIVINVLQHHCNSEFVVILRRRGAIDRATRPAMGFAMGVTTGLL